MHPLTILLIASVVVAALVATAIGALLDRMAVDPLTSLVAGFSVFLLFMIPWAGVFLWALRRAGGLDALIDRTRRLTAGDDDTPITDRAFHAELDDLARGIEELRRMLVRQKLSFEERRAAVEEIMSGLGEGLLAIGAKGSIVFANRRFRDLIGERGDLTGRNFVEAVRKEPIIRVLDRALRGDTSSERFTLAGEQFEREVEVRAFAVSASSEIAAVALLIDITQLEELQRMRKDFLDDFSHEVRTPLAGLRSAVETLDAGGTSPEEEGQLRKVVARQLGRLERLVRDLAELNRIESGELVLQKRDVDLRELLNEICFDLQKRNGGACSVEGPSAVANVDPDRAQQIFTNILDNAFRHGGGKVTCRLAYEAGVAIVRVSDEGEGIPPAELERIFRRFYRVDRSRSQNVPGTGLGLAIARHLVLLHGGTIRAYNDPGGGATFEVRFSLS